MYFVSYTAEWKTIVLIRGYLSILYVYLNFHEFKTDFS